MALSCATRGWPGSPVAHNHLREINSSKTEGISHWVPGTSYRYSDNQFQFDGELILQLYGVAMGSRSSPTFACLFVGWLEKLLLSMWRNMGRVMPYLLKRFMDDLFILWRGTVEELQEFIDHLNSVHTAPHHQVQV